MSENLEDHFRKALERLASSKVLAPDGGTPDELDKRMEYAADALKGPQPEPMSALVTWLVSKGYEVSPECDSFEAKLWNAALDAVLRHTKIQLPPQMVAIVNSELREN